MKKMTLRREVNSKPQTSKLSPANLTGTPNQFSTVCAARERSPRSFQQVIPILKRFTTRSRFRTPNVKSTADCGHSTRGNFPMEGRQSLSSEGGIGATLRRSFFDYVLNNSQAQPNCANIKKDGSAFGSGLPTYAD